MMLSEIEEDRGQALEALFHLEDVFRAHGPETTAALAEYAKLLGLPLSVAPSVEGYFSQLKVLGNQAIGTTIFSGDMAAIRARHDKQFASLEKEFRACMAEIQSHHAPAHTGKTVTISIDPQVAQSALRAAATYPKALTTLNAIPVSDTTFSAWHSALTSRLEGAVASITGSGITAKGTAWRTGTHRSTLGQLGSHTVAVSVLQSLSRAAHAIPDPIPHLKALQTATEKRLEEAVALKEKNKTAFIVRLRCVHSQTSIGVALMNGALRTASETLKAIASAK